MPEPSGAQQIEFAKWYHATDLAIDSSTAKAIWDTAWERAEESTYFSISDYMHTPGAESLDRHINAMVGYYETVREERRRKQTGG
jgi:hypothetical protein